MLALPTLASAGEVYGKITSGGAAVGEGAEVSAKCGAKTYPAVKTDKAGSFHLVVAENGKVHADRDAKRSVAPASRSSRTTKAPRRTSCSRRRTASSPHAASRARWPDEPKRKDFWDKVTIVLHPMGGLLTAIAVTFVGMKGSQVLDRRQSVDTNARLYSELMSRREEAESSLRKDMFVSIISSFSAAVCRKISTARS